MLVPSAALLFVVPSCFVAAIAVPTHCSICSRVGFIPLDSKKSSIELIKLSSSIELFSVSGLPNADKSSDMESSSFPIAFSGSSFCPKLLTQKFISLVSSTPSLSPSSSKFSRFQIASASSSVKPSPSTESPFSSVFPVPTSLFIKSSCENTEVLSGMSFELITALLAFCPSVVLSDLALATASCAACIFLIKLSDMGHSLLFYTLNRIYGKK